MITAPTLPLRSVKWTFKRQDKPLASSWTGKASIAADPWSGKWTAHVELAAIQGEENARLIKAFIGRLKGSTQTFRLPATAGAQNANSGVTVSTDADQGATSLDITGADTDLTDGQLVTVNDQLVCLTEDQSGSTITFQPPLRQDAAAGTTVITSRPHCLVSLASSSNGWRIGAQRMFGIAFDVEEAVREGDGVATPESFSLLMETGDHLLLEDGSFILLE